MPRPMVTICTHRHMNVLDLVELSRAMSQKEPYYPTKPLQNWTNHQRGMMYTYWLLTNLKKVNNILSKMDMEGVAETDPNIREQLRNWIQVRKPLRLTFIRIWVNKLCKRKLAEETRS